MFTCCFPINHSVPHFPEQDAKLRATSLRARRGGNCGNSLEVLQQFLPASSAAAAAAAAPLIPHLVTTLPGRQSAATARVLSSFGPNSSVDLGHSFYREDQAEAASCYIIHSQESGSRTIINYNDLTEMTVGEFASIAGAFQGEEAETWWHFEVRVQVHC